MLKIQMTAGLLYSCAHMATVGIKGLYKQTRLCVFTLCR